MLEHVGRENYAGLGRLIARSLRPTGRGLIHTIGRSAPAPTNPWIERHIFPGAYIPSLREILQIFEPTDMSVIDVENLRPHYARTLALWLAAFEEQRAAVTAMFGERFVRMWRLYLAGSQAAFQSGDLQLFQVLFAPARHGQQAWTRAHWYDTTPASTWNTAKS
jgi:cyclopropane-fatty-acyl-phospholipid synthase